MPYWSLGPKSLCSFLSTWNAPLGAPGKEVSLANWKTGGHMMETQGQCQLPVRPMREAILDLPAQQIV